jgi:ABC-2 type transport system permease protein
MPSAVDFRAFVYPGELSMSVLFTAIFSAASIVWDREFGFLREMLVAPVSRSAGQPLLSGNAFSGATVSTFQESSFCASPAWPAFPATRFLS